MFLDLVNQEKKIFMYHFVCMHCTFDLFFMYIFFLVVDVFINKFVAFVVKFLNGFGSHWHFFPVCTWYLNRLIQQLLDSLNLLKLLDSLLMTSLCYKILNRNTL